MRRPKDSRKIPVTSFPAASNSAFSHRRQQSSGQPSRPRWWRSRKHRPENGSLTRPAVCGRPDAQHPTSFSPTRQPGNGLAANRWESRILALSFLLFFFFFVRLLSRARFSKTGRTTKKVIKSQRNGSSIRTARWKNEEIVHARNGPLPRRTVTRPRGAQRMIERSAAVSALGPRAGRR